MLGVEVIKLLMALGEADALIAVTYILVLGAVGGAMFVASLKNLRGEKGRAGSKPPARQIAFLSRLPFQMDFPRSNVRHSLIVPFVLCTLVGILAAIMGVGGGFMMVPAMVYLLGIPAHVAVGTSLFPILLTCADVTILQSSTNHTVDVLLAMMLAVGSAIAAQIGARVSRILSGDQLLIVLASLALVVAGKMLVDIVVTPESLLAPAKAHGSAHQRVGVRGGRAGPAAAVAAPEEVLPSAEDLPFRVTPPEIDVGLFFSGAQIRVEGLARSDSRVVVVIRGGEREEEFYRKVRVGPIWVSGSKVHISGVPALFYRFSAGSLRDFLHRDAIDRFQLDEASIKTQMRIEPEGNRDRIVENWLKLKAEEGTYTLDREALARTLKIDGIAMFSAGFAWPRNVPAAVYRVIVYECRNGSVERRAAHSLPVVQVGFPGWLSSLANDRALLYGIASVLAAVAIGFGTDFLIARIFGKSRSTAH